MMVAGRSIERSIQTLKTTGRERDQAKKDAGAVLLTQVFVFSPPCYSETGVVGNCEH